MGRLEDRPYAGTWKLNRRGLVQVQPDALVYINGDLTLPGCGGCERRINFQDYITSVSVDAGTDPGSLSASVSFSIPRHAGLSIFRDGNTVLRPGLELNVYFRGYFPVEGLTRNDRVAGLSLDGLPQYPYYHVFHGVVTAENHDYSGGFYTGSISANSLLHFWNYIDLSTNGAAIATRPSNSNVRVNMRGHVFTGMSPYAIIYSLYKDNSGGASAVNFALRDATNLDASVGGEPLYSAAGRYWEQRFQSKMQGLRMYGASGELFTSSQQAFLSRLSTPNILNRSGSNQVRPLLNANISSLGARQGTDPLLFGARQLGLLRRGSNGEVIGPDLEFAAQADERDGFGFNVAYLTAFLDDISTIGQVSMFETSYQSKLDIANVVKDVAGFEFYQDVDGDLVFKPPLYNLDTSSSRVYRIEPIDIISISFNSAEPEATYMKITGNHFRNINGVGPENEFGIRGLYVDYRLVAEFGWRPADEESAYYNNPRACYYAAMAKLSVLNAKTMHTCTITIPLRPEMRPGYPVYIPHIDCFYYVDSVSHSFTFGGQCTTSLSCSARRRKFFAPGSRSTEGIQSIDLSNPVLPPKPLQTEDNEGNPVMVGFPNVVMALDPDGLSPQFLYTGIANLNAEGNPRDEIRQIIRLAVSLGVIIPRRDERGRLDPERGPWAILAGENAEIPIPPLSDLTGQTQAFFRRLQTRGVARPVEGFARRDQVDIRNEVLRDTEGLDDLANLLNALDLALQGEGVSERSSRIAVLELLSNKKASFLGVVPGEYRYYSSSHPDPEMQGMREILSDSSTGTRPGQLYLVGEADSPPTGFAALEQNTPGRVPANNYVEIVENPPVSAGLNILRRAGNGSQVVPTHQIQTVSFSSHSTSNLVRRTTTRGDRFSFSVNLDALSDAITRFVNENFPAQDVDPESNPDILFGDIVSQLELNLSLQGRQYVPFQAVRLGEEGQDFQELADRFSGGDLDRIYDIALDVFSKDAATQIVDAYAAFEVFEANPDQGIDVFTEIVNNYRNDVLQFTGTFVGQLPSVSTYFERRETSRNYQSPVFPVSDELGYEVIGAFRYGRGVSIQRGANFTRLMDLDPLRFADQEALDNFVDALLGRSPARLDAAEAALIQSLDDEPLAGPAIEILESFATSGNESDRTTMLREGLRNFLASTRDSVNKLPVANAALRLADIQPEDAGASSCPCLAAEADVFLDFFAEDSVRVAASEDQDFVALALRDAAEAGQVPWKEYQDQLRGEAQPRDVAVTRNAPRLPSPSLDASLRNFQREVDRSAQRNQEARDRLQRSAGSVQGAVNQVRDPDGRRERQETGLSGTGSEFTPLDE